MTSLGRARVRTTTRFRFDTGRKSNARKPQKNESERAFFARESKNEYRCDGPVKPGRTIITGSSELRGAKRNTSRARKNAARGAVRKRRKREIADVLPDETKRNRAVRADGKRLFGNTHTTSKPKCTRTVRRLSGAGTRDSKRAARDPIK